MEAFISFLQSHWLIISFMAPALWALVNILDVYFVGGVYRDEYDGTIISGLFQILPWPLIFLLTDFGLKDLAGLQATDAAAISLSFLGGVLFSTSFFFYFKALFQKNDVSLLQILWNLPIVVVPILSFLFFRETLPIIKYAGMAVTLLGVTTLSFDAQIRNSFSKKYFSIMMGAVLLLSGSMILEGKAYDHLLNVYSQNGFWLGFLFFSLGAFTTGVLFSVFSKRKTFGLIKKFYKIFILAEGISFLGTMASQKALDLSPSASFVAVVETFVPVFILVFSLVILLMLIISKKKNELVKQIYSEQIHGLGLKIMATVIMAIGIYLIS